jgi:hypothetical protein
MCAILATLLLINKITIKVILAVTVYDRLLCLPDIDNDSIRTIFLLSHQNRAIVCHRFFSG